MAATSFTFSMISLALAGLFCDMGFPATTVTLCICTVITLVMANVHSEPLGRRR